MNYTPNIIALTINPIVSVYVNQIGSSLRSRSSLKTSQFINNNGEKICR